MTQIPLFDTVSNQEVQGSLLDPLPENALLAADAAWRAYSEPIMKAMRSQATPPASIPQHGHWIWALKYQACGGQLSYRFQGVEYGGQIEGMMLLQLDGVTSRNPKDLGRPVVGIEFISTAPWNSPAFTATPKFRGIGQVLVASAIFTSLDCGYGGGISLHALPQAESFYRDKCGMTDVGPDPDPRTHHLRIYEMDSTQAMAYIS